MRIWKKLHILILSLILVTGFLVRLYRLDGPIADWHSWRQADTSAVSRNFVQNGYDILHPRFDDLSNIPSGKDNPQGYRFVEFPIYNLIQAASYQWFGIFTLEEWGRLISIFSSVLIGFFLYLLISRHSNKEMGLVSALFYMFTPYNIYYGRTILPDTTMVAAILGGIYFFDLWIEKSLKHKVLSIKYWSFFILSVLFTGSAFLLKPYAIFFTFPIAILAYKKFGWGLFKKWQLWIFAAVSILPLIWWRWWMMQYPEGIPANVWLLNGNGIRSHPAFFRWIGYERLIKLISGYSGAIFLVLSFIQLKKTKEWMFFLSFIISSLLYITVFATGNVQHDYYQILIMPSVAIFMALGSYYLSQEVIPSASSGQSKSRVLKLKIPLGAIFLLACLIGMFYFGWKQVRDYFNINNRSIVIAGEAVDRLTPKDAKVIANYNGDTSFLYQTKRKGWPSFEKDLPQMVSMGAQYLILVNPTEKDMVFAKDYKVLSKTPEYVIFDLRAN